jgi:hypothetical protein
MSKSTVVPSVPSAKVLDRYRKQLDAVNNSGLSAHSAAVTSCTRNMLGDIKVNPEAKAMLLESARIHDENEDRADQMAAKALDELSPHARAAFERLLGKAHDPE